jgi:hypothetical protein
MNELPSNDSAHNAEFHIKEFECLRKEIQLVLKEAHAVERYVFVAIGVSWGWLWENKVVWWGFLVPVLFAFLGAVRSYGIQKSFDTYHKYIFDLEKCFSDTVMPMGWEHFLERGPKRAAGYSAGAFVFWMILILATLVMVVLRYLHLLGT